MNLFLTLLMWWPVAALVTVLAFVALTEVPRWLPRVLAARSYARAFVIVVRDHRRVDQLRAHAGATVTQTQEMRWLLEPYRGASAVTRAAR